MDFFSRILHQILVIWINLYKNLQTNTNFPPKVKLLQSLWNPTLTRYKQNLCTSFEGLSYSNKFKRKRHKHWALLKHPQYNVKD